MNTYIILLRGINVSGQKKIRMADLKHHLADLEYHNLQTYIQSGNLLFGSDESDPQVIKMTIKKKIKDHYDFDVETFVLTISDLEKAVASNPYTESIYDQKKVYFSFLDRHINEDDMKSIDLTKYAPEQLSLIDNIIYFYSPIGYGKAKLNNNLIEKKLKLNATTRNNNTVNKLLDLAKKI